MRKIVHIDMDAFYASVELRDRPELKGKPVAVAWDGPRAVICAASYEARQFGLRSAMAVSKAKTLCPDAIYIAPNFNKYRAVSQQIHQIFRQYTLLIEPLSLDEAYLDVTQNLKNLHSATEVAQAIRADIYRQTGLTASAGIAPNKFLAKIASDWNKPNGQYVIKPHQIAAFLTLLEVGKIPGVGQVTLQKMHRLNIHTVSDLALRSQSELIHHFGRYGYRLYQLARGIDDRAVDNSHERQQLSTETTFTDDKFLAEMHDVWQELCHKVWQQLEQKQLGARSVIIKLKTSDFKTVTRSITYSSNLSDLTALQQAVKRILARLNDSLENLTTLRFRLAGVGVAELSLPTTQAQLRLID